MKELKALINSTLTDQVHKVRYNFHLNCIGVVMPHIIHVHVFTYFSGNAALKDKFGVHMIYDQVNG